MKSPICCCFDPGFSQGPHEVVVLASMGGMESSFLVGGSWDRDFGRRENEEIYLQLTDPGMFQGWKMSLGMSYVQGPTVKLPKNNCWR